MQKENEYYFFYITK